MHEKGHCFYGVPFSRPFSDSRFQERGRKHGRAGRIGILLWHRGRAIYLLPDSQGVVHRPRFQTDNWRRENSIWLDVGPYGAFHSGLHTFKECCVMASPSLAQLLERRMEMAKNTKPDMSCARVKQYQSSDIGSCERHNERMNVS